MCTCRECGEEFERGDMYYLTDTNDYICINCWENDDDCGQCDCCGNRFYYSDNINWNNNAGEYQCEDCYNEYEESHNEGINSYHAFADSGEEWEILLGKDEEDSPLLNKTGFELEVCAGNHNTNLAEIANYLRENFGDIIQDIERDGSVSNGFEIISKPFTKKAKEEYVEARLKLMLEYLTDNGFKSHNTSCCGLHIHTTRSAYGDTEEKQERNIERLILFTEFYKNELKKFSRRNDYGYCNFTSETYNSAGIDKMYLKSSKILKDINKGCGRYQVINTTNDNTIEIRVFRGTLKFETFMATLDFVHQLVIDLTTKNNNNQISWDSVVRNSKSQYLKDYCESKNIFNSQKLTDEKYNISKILKHKVDIIKNVNKEYNDILNNTINLVMETLKNIDLTKIIDNKDYTSNVVYLQKTLLDMINNNVYNKISNETILKSDYDILRYKLDDLSNRYSRANSDLNYVSTAFLSEELKEKLNEIKNLVSESKTKIDTLLSNAKNNNNNTNGEE